MTDPVFERYKEALKAGHVAAMRGLTKQALEHYADAARLADHRPLPHVSAGGVLLQLGRAADALVAYDRALERAPDDRTALSGRAAALLAQGKRREAAAALARIGEMDRDDERRRADEAATRADAVLHGADPEALLGVARDAEASGDAPGAAAALVSASDRYRSRAELHAALDACQRALALDLGDATVHLQMARLYFDLGWDDRAVERLLLLERLVTLDGDDTLRAGVASLAEARSADHPRLGLLAVRTASPRPAGDDPAAAAAG